jgi:hypothetical protein
MSVSAIVLNLLQEKGGKQMLFMSIITWEPEKRSEVRKAFAEKGAVTGGKIIGTWSDIGGCRAFRLLDGDDPKAMVVASNLWNDIATIEIIPVIESQELMKVLASKK